MDTDSDDGSEALGRAQSILKNYFESSAETKVEESSKQELSLTQLSRDDLASLTKEQLIELLTQGNPSTNLPVIEEQKKTKEISLPSRGTSRSRKKDTMETYSKGRDKTGSISSAANGYHPSDSQSEQRNTHVALNPLPLEQEERETPKSEPESDSDHQRIRYLSNHTDMNISLLSSLDASDIIHPSIKIDQPTFLEDISAVERSLEEPEDTTSDTEIENVLTPQPIIQEEPKITVRRRQRSLSDNLIIEEKATTRKENRKVEKSEIKSAYKKFLRRRKSKKEKSEKKIEKVDTKKRSKRKSKKESPAKKILSKTSHMEESVDSYAENNESMSELDVPSLPEAEKRFLQVPKETKVSELLLSRSSHSSEIENASAEYEMEGSKIPFSPSVDILEQEKNQKSEASSMVPVSPLVPRKEKLERREIESGDLPTFSSAPSMLLTEGNKPSHVIGYNKDRMEGQERVQDVAAPKEMPQIMVHASLAPDSSANDLLDDETDDSYDTEHSCSVQEVVEVKKPKKNIATIQNLLDLVGDESTVNQEDQKKEEKKKEEEGEEEEYMAARSGNGGIVDPRRYVKVGDASPHRKFVGKKLESKEGLRIKENLKAQELRRYISVGSGIKNSELLMQLEESKAQTIIAQKTKKEEEGGADPRKAL